MAAILLGRSLKATGDYLLGTVGGSIYGGAVAILIPHHSELALLAVLVIALAPLALLAAVRPNMNVVPITAIIVARCGFAWTQAGPCMSVPVTRTDNALVNIRTSGRRPVGRVPAAHCRSLSD